MGGRHLGANPEACCRPVMTTGWPRCTSRHSAAAASSAPLPASTRGSSAALAKSGATRHDPPLSPAAPAAASPPAASPPEPSDAVISAHSPISRLACSIAESTAGTPPSPSASASASPACVRSACAERSSPAASSTLSPAACSAPKLDRRETPSRSRPRACSRCVAVRRAMHRAVHGAVLGRCTVLVVREVRRCSVHAHLVRGSHRGRQSDGAPVRECRSSRTRCRPRQPRCRLRYRPALAALAALPSLAVTLRIYLWVLAERAQALQSLAKPEARRRCRPVVAAAAAVATRRERTARLLQILGRPCPRCRRAMLGRGLRLGVGR